MSASAPFLTLYETDETYQAWFRAWWSEDFSVHATAARELDSPPSALHRDFAGRTWAIGRAPPHDLDGIANPEFALIQLSSPIWHRWRVVEAWDGCFITPDAWVGVDAQEQRLAWVFVSGDLNLSSIAKHEVMLADAFIDGRLILSDLSAQTRLDLTRARLRGLSTSILSTSIMADEMVVNGDATIINRLGTSLRKVRSTGHLQMKGIANLEGANCERVTLELDGEGEIQAPALIANRLQLRNLSADAVINLRQLQCPIVDVTHARFRHIDLSGAVVSTRLDAGGANGQQLNLTASSISTFGAERATVTHLEMSEALIDTASLRDAEIGRLSMTLSKWAGRLDATGAKISSEIAAEDAEFASSVTFYRSILPGHVNFAGSHFQKGLDIRAGVDTASIDMGLATFNGAIFEPGPKDICVDLDGRQLKQGADFELCRFQGLPQFYGCGFHENASFRDAEFSISKSLGIAIDWPLVGKSLLKAWTPPARAKLREAIVEPLQDYRDKQNKRMASYERAYNALRQRAAEIGNAKYERLFHTYELRARRQRRDRDTPGLENLLSQLYDVASGYGQSIARPLWYLAGSWLAFALVYHLLAWQLSWDGALEALQFSFQQIVRPFGVWARDFAAPTAGVDAPVEGWLSHLVDGGGRTSDLLRILLVRSLATLQSLTSISLLFLTGLATRRTFGVS